MEIKYHPITKTITDLLTKNNCWFENEKIVFNAGDRCFSVAMKSEDYKKLVNPRTEIIT